MTTPTFQFGKSELELATELLALVANGFASIGVDVPPTQYVAPGAVVAYDEEQLTVNVQRLFGGQPGAEAEIQQQPTPYSAEFTVSLVRNCAMLESSGGEPIPPTVKEIQADAVVNFRDAAAMRYVLNDIRSRYVLVERGLRVAIGAVVTYGPMGGIMGVVGTISVPVL